MLPLRDSESQCAYMLHVHLWYATQKYRWYKLMKYHRTVVLITLTTRSNVFDFPYRKQDLL